MGGGPAAHDTDLLSYPSCPTTALQTAACAHLGGRQSRRTLPSGTLCKTHLYNNRSTPEAEPIVRPPSTYCYPLYLKHLPKNVSAYGQRRLLELLARGGRRGRAHDVGARTGTVLMMRASCVTPRDGTPAGRWDRGSVSGRGTYCYPKGIKLASEGLDLLLSNGSYKGYQTVHATCTVSVRTLTSSAKRTPVEGDHKARQPRWDRDGHHPLASRPRPTCATLPCQ